jgi:hypothetical protein
MRESVRWTVRLERALTELRRAERRRDSDANKIALGHELLEALLEALAQAAAPRQARLPFLTFQGQSGANARLARAIAELRHFQDSTLPIDEKRLAIGDMMLQFLDEMAHRRRVRPPRRTAR